MHGCFSLLYNKLCNNFVKYFLSQSCCKYRRQFACCAFRCVIASLSVLSCCMCSFLLYVFFPAVSKCFFPAVCVSFLLYFLLVCLLGCCLFACLFICFVHICLVFLLFSFFKNFYVCLFVCLFVCFRTQKALKSFGACSSGRTMRTLHRLKVAPGPPSTGSTAAHWLPQSHLSSLT